MSIPDPDARLRLARKACGRKDAGRFISLAARKLAARPGAQSPGPEEDCRRFVHRLAAQLVVHLRTDAGLLEECAAALDEVGEHFLATKAIVRAKKIRKILAVVTE